ncbi:MAG TPA: tetratricopeptide repeat protein, partial [Candidatus Syntrophosphaera sp.]|nr:tetratricopeptide repeat protein [Candidatus Syntrophosphaera sp.]
MRYIALIAALLLLTGLLLAQTYSEELEELALAGDPVAQNDLGQCYEKGKGVTADAEEAIRWYQLAADKGHMDGQYNLGRMLYHGTDPGQDNAEAVVWLRKAAEQGHSDAQNYLGVCYQNGQGV